jgi:magnesium-transporting ATPase (P-type)
LGGINDAAALSIARVGIVMGSGTEIAHASANALLIGNDLRKSVETVKPARWSIPMVECCNHEMSILSRAREQSVFSSFSTGS